jgi:hypothetical protein
VYIVFILLLKYNFNKFLVIIILIIFTTRCSIFTIYDTALYIYNLRHSALYLQFTTQRSIFTIYDTALYIYNLRHSALYLQFKTRRSIFTIYDTALYIYNLRHSALYLQYIVLYFKLETQDKSWYSFLLEAESTLGSKCHTGSKTVKYTGLLGRAHSWQLVTGKLAALLFNSILDVTARAIWQAVRRLGWEMTSLNFAYEHY